MAVAGASWRGGSVVMCPVEWLDLMVSFWLFCELTGQDGVVVVPGLFIFVSAALWHFRHFLPSY